MPRHLVCAALCVLVLNACSDSIEEPADVGSSDAQRDSDVSAGDVDAASDALSEDASDDTVADAEVGADAEADAERDTEVSEDITPDVAPTEPARMRLLITTFLLFENGAPYRGNITFGDSPEPVAEYEALTPTAAFDVAAGRGRLRLSQAPFGDFAGAAIFESEPLTLEPDTDYVVFLSANAESPVLTIERVDGGTPGAGFAEYLFFNAREDGGVTDLLTFNTPRTPSFIQEDIGAADTFAIDLPAAGIDLGADFDSDIMQIDSRFIVDAVAEGEGPRIVVLSDVAAVFDYNGSGYRQIRNASPPSQLRYLIANTLPGDDPVDAYAFQPGLNNLWPIGLGLAPGFMSTVPVPINQSTLRLGFSPYDGEDNGLVLETIQNTGSDELGELLVVPWLRDDGSYGAAYAGLQLAIPVSQTYIRVALGTEVSEPTLIYQRRNEGGTTVDDNGILLLNDRIALMIATPDDDDQIRLLIQPDDAAGPSYIADVTDLSAAGEDLICIASDGEEFELRCGTRGRLTTVPVSVVE